MSIVSAQFPCILSSGTLGCSGKMSLEVFLFLTIIPMMKNSCEIHFTILHSNYAQMCQISHGSFFLDFFSMKWAFFLHTHVK